MAKAAEVEAPPAIPLAAMTLAQGFDDYWTKPVDVAVLVAKLKYEFRALAAFQGSNSGTSCR